MSGRWICEANGHVYNETDPPAPGARRSATSTVRRSSSARTTGRRRSAARLDQQLGAMREVSRPLPRPGHPPAPSTAGGRSTRWPGDLLAAGPADRAGAASDDGHPEVAGRDRPRCAAPAGSWPRSSPSSSRSSGRASRPAHLDALAEAHIRRSGAIPSFKGYPGSIRAGRSRPASASRSTTRSSTASPATGSSARARSCRSTPARSSTAGTATPPGRSSSGRRPRPSSGSSTRPAWR